MSLFAHCQTADEVWTTFHSVACLCHPSQGGTEADMTALCREARGLLGDEAWPTQWSSNALPNLFDLFCLATKKRNPFGVTIEPQQKHAPHRTPEDIPGYVTSRGHYAPLSTFGSVELVFSAAAAATRESS